MRGRERQRETERATRRAVGGGLTVRLTHCQADACPGPPALVSRERRRPVCVSTALSESHAASPSPSLPLLFPLPHPLPLSLLLSESHAVSPSPPFPLSLLVSESHTVAPRAQCSLRVSLARSLLLGCLGPVCAPPHREAAGLGYAGEQSCGEKSLARRSVSAGALGEVLHGEKCCTWTELERSPAYARKKACRELGARHSVSASALARSLAAPSQQSASVISLSFIARYGSYGTKSPKDPMIGNRFLKSKFGPFRMGRGARPRLGYSAAWPLIRMAALSSLFLKERLFPTRGYTSVH